MKRIVGLPALCLSLSALLALLAPQATASSSLRPTVWTNGQHPNRVPAALEGRGRAPLVTIGALSVRPPVWSNTAGEFRERTAAIPERSRAGAAPVTEAFSETPLQEGLVEPPLPVRDEVPPEVEAEYQAHRYASDGPEEDYNIKLGPVFIRFNAGLDFEFNDNINISSSDPEADLIISPRITMTGHWQVTKYNDLTLQAAIGYRKYLNHPELDSLSQALDIAPGTELAFNIKIANFYINLHERPEIQQSPTEEITLRETFTYSVFRNTVGASIVWDLNDVQVQWGYDHINSIPLTSEFARLKYASEQVFAMVSFQLTDVTVAGVQLTASLIDYSDDFQNDGTTYSAGVFLETAVTSYLRVRAEAGYQGGTFSSGGASGDGSDLGSIYASLSLDNKLNKYVSQSLSLGHDAELGTSSNFVQTTYARYQATWNIVRRVSLSSTAFYEHAVESGGRFAQTFDQFGAGVSLGYEITRKLQATLGYDFIYRTASDGGGEGSAGDYAQNRIRLAFNYTF